jgi:NitT/TauT family transport system permease protein
VSAGSAALSVDAHGTAEPRRAMLPGWLRKTARLLLGLVITALVWEGAVRLLGIKPYYLPRLSAILAAMAATPRAYVDGLLRTLAETLIGFAAGGGFGVLTGIAFFRLRALREMIFPIFVVSQTIPVIAFGALVVLWFGNTLLAKAVIAFYLTFFPVTVNTLHVHRERGRDLGRPAGRRAARHRLLRRGCRGRAAAGVLERGAMNVDTLTSPPLAVQRGVLGAILLVLCWEGLARGLHLPSYILPAVSDILAGVWSKRAVLGEAAGYTLLEALVGYGLGCLIGIGLAVSITMLPVLRGVVLPAATAINSVPVVGYSPLILLWFGIGVASKMVMVAMAVSFTVFLSTLSGLDRVDRRAVDLMRSFGAGRLGILWRLRLPTALPLLLAGMRVSTVRSVIVAIITEMLGAYGGLGWVIYQAVLQIDFVQVWAAIFVASALSLSFFGLIGLVERRILFWK